MAARLNTSLEVLPFGVSIIVPTYREVESLPDLLKRLEPLRHQFEHFEVLIVDDNSSDGTEDVAAPEKWGDWLSLIIRKRDRGLSASVIEGCQKARFEILVVMDSDLSHPPEAIAPMVQALSDASTDFVIGSRYCEGGKIDQEWSFLRRINSYAATLLARPFTRVKDPMSGFLAFRKQDFLKSAPLNPVGYKIGLELIVKCDFKNVREIPIRFQDRQKGESKLNFKEQLKYLQHIKRLADYKFGNFSFFLQFGLVGVSGLVVNEVAVTIFHWMGMEIHWVFLLGILVALTTNFILNRKITFDHGRPEGWLRQYLKYAGACSVGAAISYGASLLMIRIDPAFERIPQIPVAVGAIAGMASNFLLSRYLVFRKSLVVARKK